MDWLLLAQALNLLGCNIYYCVRVLLALPSLIVFYFGFRKSKGADGPASSATFYEGQVLHVRRAPAKNEFRYAVRMAVLDLDVPPSWFKTQAKDHMTADEARKFAGTSGPVKLLTNPMSAGYVINPISVYYCYSSSKGDSGREGGKPVLERCIAEVTNTPWDERVTFVFHPAGQAVRKALHVSPFMDMDNTWHLEAPEPSDWLKLVVRASHPVHGDYFYADLVARRSGGGGGGASLEGGSSLEGGGLAQRVNEEAGLGHLLRYGFGPHRVAALIYWQAVKLLLKGVPMYSPPDKTYQRLLVSEAQGQEGEACTADGSCNISSRGSGGCGDGKECAAAGACAAATAAAVAGGCCGRGGMCPVVAFAGDRGGASQHSHPRNGVTGKHFMWREAPAWPWREA